MQKKKSFDPPMCKYYYILKNCKIHDILGKVMESHETTAVIPVDFHGNNV